MAEPSSQNIISQMQNSVQQVVHQVGSNITSLQLQCQDRIKPLQRHVHEQLSSLAGMVKSVNFNRNPLNQHFSQQNVLLAFASISLGGQRRTPQPVAEISMALDEVKARLAPISVYTVANPKNEFVLVAGENNSQLGFFFFRREDGDAIIEKIKEENPRLARDSRILQVTMDNVYDVFTRPREETGLQGISFRFFPDMKQVEHALQLYKEAGVPTRQFVGVPVFQAEGLTVTAAEAQYVPLFLYKEDLDVAVQSAHRQRNAASIRAQRERTAKLEEEFFTVSKQVENAGEKEKAALEKKLSSARSRFEGAREKTAAMEAAPLPKVEVGSFEEVISRMTSSVGSELDAWSQVMFVAPGLLAQPKDNKSK